MATQKGKKNNPIKWIVFILIVVALAVGGYFLWNSSLLGSPVKLSQNITPLINVTQSLTEAASTANPETNGMLQPEKIGNSNSSEMNLLLLGIDANEQADAIRLVHIDFVNKKISILSIPRDFWVKVPGMEDHGITEGKINASYGYGEYYDGKGQGVASFANTLYANFGITIDHYVVVHFDSLQSIVDEIGGIDITLEEPVDGYAQGLPYFSAGPHHLDGETAIKFMRIRYPDSDLNRIDRQTIVLKSAFKKLQEPANFLKILNIVIKAISNKSVISDISISEASRLISLAGKIDSKDLVFNSIPQNLYVSSHTEAGAFIFVPSSDVEKYISDFMHGKN